MAAEACLVTAGCLLEGLKFLPQHHKNQKCNQLLSKNKESVDKIIKAATNNIEEKKVTIRSDATLFYYSKIFLSVEQAHANKVLIQKQTNQKWIL